MEQHHVPIRGCQGKADCAHHLRSILPHREINFEKMGLVEAVEFGRDILSGGRVEAIGRLQQHDRRCRFPTAAKCGRAILAVHARRNHKESHCDQYSKYCIGFRFGLNASL
jgi:hypothetical protein